MNVPIFSGTLLKVACGAFISGSYNPAILIFYCMRLLFRKFPTRDLIFPQSLQVASIFLTKRKAGVGLNLRASSLCNLLGAREKKAKPDSDVWTAITAEIQKLEKLTKADTTTVCEGERLKPVATSADS